MGKYSQILQTAGGKYSQMFPDIIRRKDASGKRVVAVMRAPKGEPSQKGFAEVVEFPTQEVTATRLAPRTKEEEKESKRVKEYVESQRFYARQREIPRIGVGSPEERSGMQMEAIAEGIRRSPFINPLAPTISGLETGIEGAKRLRQPGILPKVLGAAEMALGTGQILTPEFTAPISMAGEIVPEITQGVTAPITTLTKPETEGGKIGAMIGDMAYQGLLLGMAKSFKPSGKASRKLTTEEAELGMARAEAGDVRVRNIQEANIAEQIKNDVELRKQAKTDLQKKLDKKLSEAEFDTMLDEKIAQKREYQKPSELLPPSGKSEVLPSLLYDAEGNPVPITSVRETRETAQAPLRMAEKETFPFSSEFAFRGKEPVVSMAKERVEPPKPDFAKEAESLGAKYQGEQKNKAGETVYREFIITDPKSPAFNANVTLREGENLTQRIKQTEEKYFKAQKETVIQPIKASIKGKPDPTTVLKSVAGAVYGIEEDEEGNVKINPLKFALGALAGAVVLNPNIRAKLAKAIGKDASKLTDEQIVSEYKAKFGEAINVRKPNEKLYVENVRVDKFSDPAGIAEAVTGLNKKEILSARRKLDDVQIDALAKEQGELLKDIKQGKIESGRAFSADEIRAVSSETERVIREAGSDIAKYTPEQKNVVKAMLGLTYESGLAFRELGKGVSSEIASFLKSIDPEAPIKEKMPPSALEMLAEFAGAVKLASLSGIVRSLVGNAFSRALYKPEILISSQINKALAPMLRGQRDRFAEEALYNRIIGKGTAKEGLKTAREIFIGDESALAKNAFLQSEGYSFEGAIPGKFGKVVRTPFRAQGSVDAIFRLPLRDIELARMSIRKAMQESKNKTMEETLNAAQKIFDEAPDEWISKADDNAKYWTYQNKGGSTLRGFSAFRQYPIVRLFVPFFTTQANMAKFILERTPFAPLTPSFVQSVWEAVSKGELKDLTDAQKRLGNFTGRDFTPEQIGFLSDKLARMATGTSILGGTYLLVDHVLDGNITADLPADQKERAAWDLQGKKPYSIKVPGTNWWISYSGFEPVSSFLTASAQYYQAKDAGKLSPEEEKSWHKDITKYFTGLMKSYSEAPSFVGIKYLTDGFFEEGELSGKAESAVANFVVGLVTPTIVRQTTNLVDPRARQPEGVAERIASTIPFASKYIPGRKNVLGDDITLSSPGTRLAGVLVSKESEEKINQEIARLGVAPLPPSELYSGFKLKREEILELQNLAGKNLKPALKPLIESEGWEKIPDQFKIDVIEKIKRNIYEVQREVLFPKMRVKGQIKNIPEVGSITEDEKRQWMELIEGAQ